MTKKSHHQVSSALSGITLIILLLYAMGVKPADAQLKNYVMSSSLDITTPVPVTDESVYFNIFYAESIWNLDEAIVHKQTSPPNILAARGEKEHLQIILLPIDRKRTISFKISDFKDSQGNAISNANATLRTVEKIEDKEDVLLPASAVVVDAERRFIWLSIHVPLDAVPGNYTAIITLTDNVKSLEKEIKLQVLDVRLPIRPSIPAVIAVRGEGTTLSLQKQLGLPAGSEQLKEKMAEYMDFLINYRISPFVCNWMDNKQVDTYTSPWPLYDARSKKYLDDPRITYMALPFVKRSDRTYLGFDTTELRKNMEALRQAAAPKKGYVYVEDEPNVPERYNIAKDHVRVIHESASDCIALTTFYTGYNQTLEVEDLKGIPRFFGNNGKQIYAFVQWAWRGNYNTAEAVGAGLDHDNEEMWLYITGGMGTHPNFTFSASGIQNRAIIWRVWREGGTGFLYWVANSLVVNSDKKLELYQSNGNGVLVYPGDFYGTSGPLASCRLERWLDGMEDYEYLTIIKNKIGKAAADLKLETFFTLPTTTVSYFPGTSALRDLKLYVNSLVVN